MTNISDIKRNLARSMPLWLADQKRMLLDRPTEWLREFSVDQQPGSKVKLVRARYERIAQWYRCQYALSGLDESAETAVLSVSTRVLVESFFVDVPLYDFHPENPGYYRIDEYGFLLAQVITTGWKDEAELIARHGFVELNRLMDRGVTVRLMPWFMLELAKDWLGANVSLDTEFRSAEIRDLGIWQKLLDGWRSAEGAAFDALMSEMADYHLSQSADADGDGDWKEFEDMAYWLFPVELLAVLRLREWLGIPVVKLTHPLFNATSLGRLCPTPKWPQHDVLDAVEKKFRSIYPNTPSLSDLPRLRQEQG